MVGSFKRRINNNRRKIASFRWKTRLLNALLSWNVFISILMDYYYYALADPFPVFACSPPMNSLTVVPIMDGDAYYNTRSEYVTLGSDVGACGNKGITLNPDAWHNPTIVASDPPSYRIDYSLYDWFQVFVRCPDDTAWEVLSVYFTHWVASYGTVSANSRPVFMRDYIQEKTPQEQSNPQATNWKRVRIPIKTFVTATWGLGGVESVVFNKDSLNRKCVIDNMALLITTPPQVLVVSIETSKIISFNLTKRFEIKSARNLSNYFLYSETDGDYLISHQRHPIDVGSSIRFKTFNKDDAAVSEYRIYLEFEKFLKEGIAYFLYIGNGLKDSGDNLINPTTLEFTYTDFRVVPFIQVNQEGYLPNANKIAYVSGYFADMNSAVFAVGANGSIFQRNNWNFKWSKMSNVPPDLDDIALRGVAALTEKNVWSIGDKGVLLQYDGSIWSRYNTSLLGDAYNSMLPDLRSISICSTLKGVIVGHNGTILNYNHLENKWILDNSFYTQLGGSTSFNGKDISKIKFESVFVAIDGTTLIGGDGILLQWDVNRNAAGSWMKFTGVTGTDSITTVCGMPYSYNAENARVMGPAGERQLYTKYGNVLPIVYNTAADNDIDWNGCWMSPSNSGSYLVAGSNATIRLASFSDNSWKVVPVNTALLYKNVTHGNAALPTLNSIACMDETIICFAVGDTGTILWGPLGGTGSSLWDVEEIVGSSSNDVNIYGISIVPSGSLRVSNDQRQMKLLHTRVSNSTLVVGTYDLKLRRSNDALSGGDIWTVNFTSFVPSTASSASSSSSMYYRLYLPGVGISEEFSIANNALNNAAWHSCRAFYYARSGMALLPPYAEPQWSRPIDHEFNSSVGGRKIDAAYHWSVASSPLSKGETICPLTASSCPEESMRDAAGGWFDAGDYSKYVLNACPTVWYMLNAYEMFPDKYEDDWNLPETGDGIPDVLNEVQWELSWLEKMQSSDGGFYDKVASESWETGLPSYSNSAGYPMRYVLPQSTSVTACAGALFAQASRIYQQWQPQAAERYLERATNATLFLEKYPTDVPINGFKNPTGHVSGPYYDSDDKDNRCHLAAEMYRTTCDIIYALAFDTLYQAGKCNFGTNEFQSYGKPAKWAFYNSKCNNNYDSAATVIKEKIKADFKSDIKSKLSYAKRNPYMSVSRFDVYYWINFGSFAQIKNVRDLIYGVQLFPDLREDIIHAIHRQVDITLGANPLSLSFITGVGDNRVMHPLHWARWQEGEPTPGTGVFGPACHMSDSNKYYKMAQSDANNYPSLARDQSALPILRRYADHPYLVQNSEFGINDLASQCSLLMITKNDSFSFPLQSHAPPTPDPTPALPVDPMHPPTPNPTPAPPVPTAFPTMDGFMPLSSAAHRHSNSAVLLSVFPLLLLMVAL